MTNYQLLQKAYEQGRFPQAILCVGPLYNTIAAFSVQLSQLLLCSKRQKEPCGQCQDCQMVAQYEHPDMEWIKPEKNGGVIKIDQIRDLQQTVYLTPQRAAHRIIVIESADKMNTASANALLKILEEPAKHTVFVLIAQQLSTVLPTVLSRCQLFRFPPLDESYRHNLLLLAEQYSEGSPEQLLLQQAEAILDGFLAILEKKVHPCSLASKWASFDANTLWWFFYLLYAQLLQMHYSKIPPQGVACEQLIRLSSLLNPLLVFSQLDKISGVLRKLSRNLPCNNSLALEELLFDLRPL